MLHLLLIFILLSGAFWGWGNGLLQLTVGDKGAKMADTILLGMAFLGILSGIWYCCLPVNQLFAWFSMLTGWSFLLVSRNILVVQWNTISSKTWWLGGLVFVFICFKAAVPNTFYDNGLYYIQTMKWIKNYALVPGLANLHFRLGTISLWHILMAPFTEGFFYGFDDLGELLFFCFFISCFDAILGKKSFDAFLHFFFIVFAFLFSTHFLGTGSPDLACCLFGIFCLNKLREFIYYSPLEDPKAISPAWIYVLVFSLFLLGIKLSSVPYLLSLVICIVLITMKKKIKPIAIMVGLGSLGLGSLVYRSWILSGYLLFPVFKGGPKSQWLVPDEITHEYLLLIKGFARHMLSLAEIKMGKDYLEIGKLPFSDWIPLWIADRTAWDIFLFACVLGGWLSLIWATHQFVRKSFLLHWPKILFTWICSFLLLFWFTNAPDIRFGMGIFGFLFPYFFAFFGFKIMEQTKFDPLRFDFPILITACILSIFLFRNKAVISHYGLKLPMPVKGKYWIDNEPNRENFYYARGFDLEPNEVSDQCWDAPLPCAPKIVKGLRFRGKSLKDSFVVGK